MSNAGSALMGVGEAGGENKTKKAVEDAIESPLVGCPKCRTGQGTH